MSKLYVIVRRDISPSQQAVQAGHAVAQFCLMKPMQWTNGTLVYLGVKSEIQLLNWIRKLDECVIFREPDIGNQITAIASLSNSDGIFQKLNLLKL